MRMSIDADDDGLYTFLAYPPTDVLVGEGCSLGSSSLVN